MKLIKTTFLFVLISCLSVLAASCKKNDDLTTDTGTKTIKPIKEREAKVYIGIADKWHEMADASSYDKWTYVRTNAAGFYTNFIVMWKNSYQNTEDPQTSCNDMRKAFLKNGCFFETSMETAVNSGANGVNNETTDKKYLDLLINAGFNVDVTSLNYGVSDERIKTLRTYNGSRSCLTLVGPWTIGGEIESDAVSGNKQDRANFSITDGMETDGPLGFWYNDSGEMREGSYSLVKYVENNKQISAVMLAPYDAGVSGYNQSTDYLKESVQCVLDHEDNNASPDMWTIWTYGAHGDEPVFPESVVNAAGETEAANTLIGVGYWVLKHLNNFPTLKLTETGNVNSDVVTLANDTAATVSIVRGSDGIAQYTIPFSLSNEADPQIEISPLIHATIDDGSKDWSIGFMLAGKDVTDKMIYNGGVNCISGLRLTNDNKLTLQVNVKSKSSTSTSPVVVKIEMMSNISNTKNKKIYTVTVKTS